MSDSQDEESGSSEYEVCAKIHTMGDCGGEGHCKMRKDHATYGQGHVCSKCGKDF